MTIYACCKPLFQVFYVFSNVCFKSSIWMLHMLLLLYQHVPIVCFKCFICFILMLQVFHLIVVKVYWDVSYVAMPIQRIFQVFHLFQTNVANILSRCFKSRLRCCTVLVADGQQPAAATFLLLVVERSSGSTNVDSPCRRGVGVVAQSCGG
jgi:hypothetical protein